eukprot:scaffold109730_cov30-Tisochrysis_lutea.AAC.2
MIDSAAGGAPEKIALYVALAGKRLPSILAGRFSRKSAEQLLNGPKAKRAPCGTQSAPGAGRADCCAAHRAAPCRAAGSVASASQTS